MGFEPTTPGLKVRSSTAELQALASIVCAASTASQAAPSRRCLRAPAPFVAFNFYAALIAVNRALNRLRGYPPLRCH